MLIPKDICCMQAKTSAKTETTAQRSLSLAQKALQQCCPLGLAAMIEMFCVSALSGGVATSHMRLVEHLKCGECECRTEVLILFN